jgi:hypothetical protein
MTEDYNILSSKQYEFKCHVVDTKFHENLSVDSKDIKWAEQMDVLQDTVITNRSFLTKQGKRNTNNILF